KLSTGIPAVPVPSLDNGIIDIPGNVTAITMPHNFRRGYVQSWNVTVQKGIKWGFVGEVGYVATRQIRELGFLDLNWADIGKGAAGQQLNTKFGRTAATRLVSPVGNSTYDAFQARLQRRFRNGYSFETNYTFSKSIALASNVSGSDDLAPIQIPQFYYLNRGLSTLDRPHRLNITNVLELPFGKGHKWLNSGGAASAILGGWQINNLISIHSGSPFGI